MTHAELVQRAARWLRSQGYKVVFTEMTTGAGERPDAIGFNSHGNSCLIECKTSHADFIGDKEKSFRRNKTRGMGQFRYYLCRKDLIAAKELPEGWGLLYVLNDKRQRVRVIVESQNFQPKNHFTGLYYERWFLAAILRRVDIQWGLHNLVTFQEWQNKLLEKANGGD